MRVSMAIALIWLCLGAAVQAFAQRERLEGSQQKELSRWIKEFKEYQEWEAKWLNRRQPGFFTGWRERKVKPDPPIWLHEACESILADEILPEACVLLQRWEDDLGTARLRQTQADTRIERPAKTMWWEHVHIDTIGTASAIGASARSFIGLHYTISLGSRFQVFAAPGVLLLCLPDGEGYSCSPAYDYGFSVRLFDFIAPMVNRPMSLHMSLIKAWGFGALPAFTGPQAGADIVTLSLTFKKQPS